MFAWSWAYRAFSRLHRRELRNMEPIRDFAELVLETAISEGDTSGECGAMRNGLENDSLVFRRGEVNRNGTVDEERRCVPTTIVKKNEEEGGIGDKMEDGSFEAKRGELETGNTEGNPGGNGRMDDYCLKARCGELENDSALEDDRRGLLENATTTESEHPENGGSERVVGDQVVQEREGNGVGVASGNGTVARKEWSSGVGRRRRTALSNMAERESHRKYPNAMLDEVCSMLMFFLPILLSSVSFPVSIQHEICTRQAKR